MTYVEPAIRPDLVEETELCLAAEKRAARLRQFGERDLRRNRNRRVAPSAEFLEFRSCLSNGSL